MRTTLPILFCLAACSGASSDTHPWDQPHQSNEGIDWRDQVIYQIMIDRFSNGDPNNDINVAPSIPGRYHGGDWQGVIDAVEAAVDVAWQVRFPSGISPTELTAADPAIFQIAPMAIYSPFGPGSYARPQFRLVYAAAHLNDAARDQLYPLEDPRRAQVWVHYLGLQAEWWFNSTYRQ